MKLIVGEKISIKGYVISFCIGLLFYQINSINNSLSEIKDILNNVDSSIVTTPITPLNNAPMGFLFLNNAHIA